MPERKNSVVAAAGLLTQPFTHTILGQVDGYCAYLSRFQGTHKFHEHAKDELYLVLEGEILIDYYGGPSVPVRRKCNCSRPEAPPLAPSGISGADL
jgi:hypothetical protein